MYRLLIKKLISLVSVVMLSQIVNASPDNNRVQIGFNATLNDGEVIELLESNGASPKALFMWASGISTTYRNDESMSPAGFIARARNDIAKFYQDALDANTIRLENYVEEYDQEEVLNSKSLQTEVRLLLNIRSEINGALTSTEAGLPMIFGLEIQEPEDTIVKIKNSKRVKISNAVDHRNNQINGVEKPNLKPELLRIEYRDPVILTASPQDLYGLAYKAIN